MLSWLGLKKPSLDGVVPQLPVPDKEDDRWGCWACQSLEPLPYEVMQSQQAAKCQGNQWETCIMLFMADGYRFLLHTELWRGWVSCNL